MSQSVKLPLTRRINGVVVYVGAKNLYSTGQIPCKVEPAGVREMMDRLAACEETGLTPEKVLPKKMADEVAMKLLRLADLESFAPYERLRKLAEADKDGRLAVLPCKVGDTIYHISKVRTSHFEDDKIIIDDEGRWKIYEMPFALVHLSYIGKSYFLTREEAEKALEAKRNG